jgi:hypothetical protein
MASKSFKRKDICCASEFQRDSYTGRERRKAREIPGPFFFIPD